MPWEIVENAQGCAESEPWGVVQTDDDELVGCHETRAEALDQLAALNANEGEMAAGLGGGAQFVGLVAVEGLETVDGRLFELDSLRWREPPLPLMLQQGNPEGFGDPHAGARIAGRIDSVERDPADQSRVLISGQFDTGEDGQTAERLASEGTMRGISVDAWADDYDLEAFEDGSIRARFSDVEIHGATMTPFPAFAETMIWLAEMDQPDVAARATGSEVAVEGEILDDEPMFLLAAGGPVAPPRAWFDTPEADGPCGLTVTDDGHVYGHIATWGRNHLGAGELRTVTAFRSRSGYRYFHLGDLVCDDGSRVSVGQITMGGMHADTRAGMSLREVEAHYHDVGLTVADVRATDGNYGIWVSGAVRPSITDEQMRALRASKPSGDWRKIDGSHELVAIHQVNTPGFPVPRISQHVEDGEVTALVAALGPDPSGTPATSTAELVALRRRVDRLERLGQELAPVVADRLARRIGAERRTRERQEPPPRVPPVRIHTNGRV